MRKEEKEELARIVLEYRKVPQAASIHPPWNTELEGPFRESWRGASFQGVDVCFNQPN